jgi:hypothetical protein
LYRITMSRTISAIELERIRAKLREALGRDLTPEECRYFGLSRPIVSEEESPPQPNTNRRKS